MQRHEWYSYACEISGACSECLRGACAACAACTVCVYCVRVACAACGT